MSELIVNTISGLNDLSVGNTTVNSTVNSTSFSIGNSTVNTAITSTGITQNGEALSPVSGMRNKIINGNFDIWQRATSFTSSGYGGADRWAVNVSGSSHTTSRQSFTLGQTDVPGEPTYYQRSVVTSSAGAGNFCIPYQKIESVRTLAGQTATLSFWAKADASKNMAVEFYQNFGTGGSPSSAVGAIGVTTCALTTSWQKFTITVSVPSISGKTLGTDNNDWFGLFFWFDAGSTYNSRTNSLGQQSGTFDIAQVQLEAGSVATPFEHRLPGVELSLCQRYYIDASHPNNGTVLGVTTPVTIGFNYGFSFSFPTKMRAAPTLTWSEWLSIDFPATAPTFQSVGRAGVNCYKTASSTNPAAFFYGGYTASAEL